MEEKQFLNTLETCSTVDLITELLNRCSPAIFIGTKYEGQQKDCGWISFEQYKGRLETCRGLCKEMDAILERHMVREECERALGQEN